ncbi:putative thioesterase family protein [Botrytis fragariae]|uniref:Putative thioesterase family protein n=1 Tax=Botrytis fragariae TaxID=1964551 RepID=A0A8H6B0K8_9HELO|nr:putative thioesterase family protein [Botrytis fragariae]KAF5876988.1 putative thioesterase family protein [Botrytis fragariae]
MAARLPIQALRSCKSILQQPSHFSQTYRHPFRSQSLSKWSTRAYSTPPPPQSINHNISATTEPSSQSIPQHRDLRSQFSSGPVAPIPSPSSPKRKRSLRPTIYASLFLLIGLTTGQYVSLVLSPPALPEPSSPSDELMTSWLHAQASKIPLVQSLTEDPVWQSWDAYSTFTPEERPHRLTTGPLGGSRSIGGYQRVFYNSTTGEFISIVYLGGALGGWPGVVHGGLIATIMDESLGRCAIRQLAAGTGVTAQLSLQYLKPSVTNAFYVVRCTPVIGEEGGGERKRWVEGRLETLEGRVCVEAKGLFVAPKNYKTRVITAGF